VEPVGEEDQGFLLVRVPVLDSPEQNRRLAMLRKEGTETIWSLSTLPLFWNRTHLNGREDRVGLHPRDEEDRVPRQLPEPHIIVVAAVNGQDPTRLACS